ncbi:MAG: anthranilate synthase component I [Candidatus Omnitrophica bacterium]|nr:anthranilate synthase component I [Candidatus Omnitrophota bacterium]
MIYPSKNEFIKLAKGHNLIPVYKEIMADFETPLSCFMKIDNGRYSYLLESVEKGEKLGRYSFLGSDPSLVFQSKGKRIQISEFGKTRTFLTKKDPLYEIKKLSENYKFAQVKGLPRFCGGFVGYMGYETVRFFERLPKANYDDLKLPDTVFLLTDSILIFDHLERVIKIVSNAAVKKSPKASYRQAEEKILRIESLLKKEIALKKAKKRTVKLSVSSNMTKNKFKETVRKAKSYIKKGDVIQVVLSQRLKIKLNSDALTVYRALRHINPSPYMFYLNLNGVKLVGSSPEIMVRTENKIVEVRPIAGTRRRGRDAEEDESLAKELLADPKERAEHIMLVDLGRNDIGRVCRYETVKVNELMTIEKYSHVMHIVSDVTGTLEKNKDLFDVIRATFPAGTVTGAPKIRAMEIIDELENVARGPYAGCVGYFSFSGNEDFCITIRTIVVKGDYAYIQAGAGIVNDSKPEGEYKETLNKARAMIKAIEDAEKGLD